MKMQAAMVGVLIGVLTTVAQARSTEPSADAATDNWVSIQSAAVSASSASPAPAANTQQPSSGVLAVRSGETSDSENTPRLVLLALLAMGSIALRRSGSAQ